jgi:SAM-dependent methyltransferase
MSDVKKQYIKYLDSPEGADKYNKFKKILYGKKDTLVLRLFGVIFPKFKGRKKLSILDVGGGDGKRLMHMMELFDGKHVETKAVLVEPSKTFTENCKKEAKKLSRDVCVLRMKFEDFSTTEKFDLVIFVHSIYTFSDGQYLKKAMLMLAKGGILVIVAND